MRLERPLQRKTELGKDNTEMKVVLRSGSKPFWNSEIIMDIERGEATDYKGEGLRTLT